METVRYECIKRITINKITFVKNSVVHIFMHIKNAEILYYHDKKQRYILLPLSHADRILHFNCLD